MSVLDNRVSELVLTSICVSLYLMSELSLRGEAAASYEALQSKNQAAQGLRLLSALCDAVVQGLSRSPA